MRNTSLMLGAIALLMCTSPTSIQSETRVAHDRENVIASRLIGKWTTEQPLTKKLTGAKSTQREIEFINDEPILAVIPLPELLRETEIYLAGIMNLSGTSHPFVLISHHGNPRVVFFRDSEEHPMGDTESFIVMMAIAKDEEHDLLFIGGDFSDEPFSAFSRATDDDEQ